MCTAPTGGGKDSVCTVPTRGGENSGCTVSGYTQASSVQKCIYSRKRSASGGQTKAVPSGVGKTWITGLIRDGYKLPFRECPNLSRVPCIISSYAGFDKQNALWTSIQDLLQKGAVEVVHTPESLGFYSCLFLVPKPGNRRRPVIDLSSLHKFLAIPKFKMETPESIRASLRKGEWVTSTDLRRLLTRANSHPVSKIPRVSFQRRHLPVHQPPLRDIYRRLKRRLGRSLRSKLYRRALVSFRKAPSHQPIRNEGGSSGSAILQDRLQEQSSPYRLRQHLSGGLYQQTGRHKISRTLCPNVENSHLVSPKQCHTRSKTCTGLTQCDSGRTLKEEPDRINRVVPFSTDFQTNLQTLGESPSGPVRNQPEQKTSYICLSDSGSSGMGSRCPQHSMGKPGCLRVPSHRPAAQGCTKTSITNMQDNSDSTRLADKTMVLGPGGDVSGHFKTTTTHTHSAKTTTEQPLPCQPNIPEPPRLVSRSSALQEHGFTAEVAERIAAPQRLSTRSIYTSKWTVFQRWCTEKQVDFRSPYIGDICKFFWYLFNDLNRCPSTIEGYRTAIADTLGNTKQNTRGMLLLTKAKRPLKFKMLCGFNKHAVKLRMHKAAPYAFPIPLNTF